MGSNATAQNIDAALSPELKDILKDEFGTGIPQIATLVFIVLGSFQLQGFNAGAWTIIAAACFFLVFMFRGQISSHLLRTAAGVLAFLALAAIGAWYMYSASSAVGKGFDEWLKGHPILLSAYFSFVTTTALACLVVSYRKQEKLGQRYPDIIEAAVNSQLRSSNFYKKNVIFKIVVTRVDTSWVYFDTELSYEVVNRREDPQEWRAEYLLNDATGTFEEIKINASDYSPNDRKYRSGPLLFVPVSIPGNGRAEVSIKVKDRFRLVDSDIFTSYHPATDLTVQFSNEVPTIRLFFDTLHIPEYRPTTDGNVSSLTIPDGILPFQGVRVRWEV